MFAKKLTTFHICTPFFLFALFSRFWINSAQHFLLSFHFVFYPLILILKPLWIFFHFFHAAKKRLPSVFKAGII